MIIFREYLKQIKIALLLLGIFTFLTGILYPLAVTGLAEWLFPWQANGSLLKKNGQIVGSLWIGQYFDAANYFWGRPSATEPFPYNGSASGASNLSPSNPHLLVLIKDRMANLKKYGIGKQSLIPVDLITASGSGLDPEISPLAALYQVPRVAKARKMTKEKIISLVMTQIEWRTFLLLGEPRVNVLRLNLALDELSFGQSV